MTNQISDAKRDNEDLRMELASLQQKWTKDKNDLLHKARQEEKVPLKVPSLILIKMYRLL